MISRIQHEESQCEVIGRDLRGLCAQFIRGLPTPNSFRFVLDKIKQWIECLPLDSEDFGLVRTRIDNARRYCESSEFGAAKYEIRLLSSVLRNRLGWPGLDEAPLSPAREFGPSVVSRIAEPVNVT